MRRELYLCAYAAEFPAQALLRLQPDIAALPVVVLEGQAPEETVCALNLKARQRGAEHGMTRLDAESIPGLRLLKRSAQSESAARAVFLECAAQFSPRIEEASRGTACAFVLDISGAERLFGPPEKMAQRLRAALAAAGFRTSIAVSANFHTARMKSAHSRVISVIPAGGEANALANLPIDALDLTADHAETFAIWGIRTLGELAALPEAELVTRLSAEARVWSALAYGQAAHLFQPVEPVLALEEFCEFETPVEQIDSLLFVAARMIDSLATRANGRALALAALTARMRLEDGSWHERIIRPALPSVDRRFLLKLVHMEIGAHPPHAAVVSLLLRAEAGQASQMQLGLFAPEMPEPSKLDVTLARLKAIVGEDRVGSPLLDDTHRADSFRMENFVAHVNTNMLHQHPQRVALRRVRPPEPLGVVLRAARPIAFRNLAQRFEITEAYGPWRTSGCWWSVDTWDGEEWDVLAMERDGTPVACVLSCNRQRNVWHLEAFYD